MNEIISKELAKSIANVAIFLEFSDSAILNEDAAIQVMEQFASDLQQLTLQERQSLSRALMEISGEYEEQARRQFVANLPEAFGLSESS